VYYRPLEGLGATRERLRLPIDTNLPLEEGANAIAIVVRENEHLSARRVFGVYRSAGPILAGRANTAKEKADTRAQ